MKYLKYCGDKDTNGPVYGGEYVTRTDHYYFDLIKSVEFYAHHTDDPAAEVIRFGGVAYTKDAYVKVVFGNDRVCMIYGGRSAKRFYDDFYSNVHVHNGEGGGSYFVSIVDYPEEDVEFVE